MRLFVTDSKSSEPGSTNRSLGLGETGIYAESDIELKAYERLSNFVARLNTTGVSPVDAGSHGLYYKDDALYVSKKVLDFDKVRGWYIKPKLERSIWADLCKGEAIYQRDIDYR